MLRGPVLLLGVKVMLEGWGAKPCLSPPQDPPQLFLHCPSQTISRVMEDFIESGLLNR